MATRRLLSVGLENGFQLDVDTTTPDGFRSRVESHHCYYALPEGSGLSYCVFTLRFESPPEPLPEPTATVGPLLVALALLGRSRIGRSNR